MLCDVLCCGCAESVRQRSGALGLIASRVARGLTGNELSNANTGILVTTSGLSVHRNSKPATLAQFNSKRTLAQATDLAPSRSRPSIGGDERTSMRLRMNNRLSKSGGGMSAASSGRDRSFTRNVSAANSAAGNREPVPSLAGSAVREDEGEGGRHADGGHSHDGGPRQATMRRSSWFQRLLSGQKVRGGAGRRPHATSRAPAHDLLAHAHPGPCHVACTCGAQVVPDSFRGDVGAEGYDEAAGMVMDDEEDLEDPNAITIALLANSGDCVSHLLDAVLTEKVCPAAWLRCWRLQT